jgi:hypothetical protein
VIADDVDGDPGEGLGGASRVAGQKDRRDIGVEGQLDALWALWPVGKTANRGGLADPDDAVIAVHPDDAHSLTHHRRHRQDVGADRWHIDQKCLDLANSDQHRAP